MLISFQHFRRFFSKRLTLRSLARSRGFTLVELIVVSAIILLITGFVMFQQAKFNSATLMRSLTYSVALSMRQAQVYGTSVREFSGAFAPGYGVYIPASGGSANTYYLFADIVPATVGNGAYDNSTEALPTFTLGKGYIIGSVCAVAIGGGAPPPASSLSLLL